jgi:serine/threonine protein kinase/WD40 repeat protein/tetratricopeptide (TPR) repeat protein
MADSKAERNPIDPLAEEFAQRLRRGERPTLTEYVRQYPELADDIRELFPALVMMEQLKPVSPVEADVTSRRPEYIGDYRLLREIGRGGMGIVYEAEQISLGRHVALKVFPTDQRTNPTYLERFRREAKAAARLHHTNIVPVFGVGEGDGVHYYAMQFIHGEGLDKVLHDLRRLRASQGVRGEQTVDAAPSGSVALSLLSGQFEQSPPREAMNGSPTERAATSSTLSGTESEAEYCRGVARLGLQVAEGLAYAHKQGILHRDIKPSNLLLDLQGTVWITDFGLAKTEDADELTHTGDIVGTIRYMAPERFEGASLPQSDVYALGMTLYEMLTLRPAFDDSNRARLMQRIVHEEPPSPRSVDPRIPRDLETVVLKALAHDPLRRYATAEDLAEDLRRFLADRPVQARRSRLPERFWRWCRRNPAVASLTGVIALLLIVVAVGSSLSAWSLRAAERDAREKLWRSKLNEAQATVHSRLPGQRFTSLRRIEEAHAIAGELGLGEEDRRHLRNAAIAALALPDYEIVREWDTAGAGDFDERMEHYARVEADGLIHVRRFADDQVTATLPAPDRPVSLRLGPNGRYLAVCPKSDESNGPIQLWELAGTACRRVHEGISLSAAYADFTPDGKRLVYESIRCLTVVDVASGQAESWPLNGSLSGSRCVRCRPGGREAAVSRWVDKRCIVQVRDLASGKLRAELPHESACTCFAWHPDGRLLAAAYWTSPARIVLWDLESGRPILELNGHKSIVVNLRFTPDGNRLLSMDEGGMMRLWHVPSGRQLSSLALLADRAVFSADGRTLAVFAGSRGKMQQVRFAAGEEVCPLGRFLGTEEKRDTASPLPPLHFWRSSGATEYLRPVFSPDERFLAVLLAQPNARRPWALSLLAFPSGQEISQLPSNGDYPHEPVGFTRDGALWTRTWAGDIYCWPRSEAATPGAIRLGPPEPVLFAPDSTGVALTPDGQALAVASGDVGVTLLHGGASGSPFRTGSQEDVCSVSLSPDGRWVASGSNREGSERAARVWEARTGRLVQAFDVLGPCEVAFSPDGRWLAAGGSTLRLWRAGAWEEPPRLFPEEGSWGWAFSPDGRLLALGGQGRIRLVRPEDGAEVARLACGEQTLFRPLGFSPSGTRLLVRGEDSEAFLVWDLRRIRRQLAAMDLDWDDPLLPEDPAPSRSPPVVEIVGAELASDPETMGKYQLSLAALRLLKNPLDVRAHSLVGRLLENDAPDVALARYSIALALEPGQRLVTERRAKVALLLKRYPLVIADTSAILEQYPDQEHALRMRAQAYQRSGRHAEAVADISTMLRYYPNAAHLYDFRAVSKEALADKAGAAADRLKAQQLEPEDAQLLDNQAWRLLTDPPAQRDAVAALKLAQKAVNLAPNAAAYLNTLGVAQYRNEQFPEAIATLEKSLSQRQGQSEAYDLFFLAMCHQKLGQPTRARDCYDRALRWWRAQKNLPARDSAELKAFQAEAQACLDL